MADPTKRKAGAGAQPAFQDSKDTSKRSELPDPAQPSPRSDYYRRRRASWRQPKGIAALRRLEALWGPPRAPIITYRRTRERDA